MRFARQIGKPRRLSSSGIIWNSICLSGWLVHCGGPTHLCSLTCCCSTGTKSVFSKRISSKPPDDCSLSCVSDCNPNLLVSAPRPFVSSPLCGAFVFTSLKLAADCGLHHTQMVSTNRGTPLKSMQDAHSLFPN